jgi:uncharacterized membrane protein
MPSLRADWRNVAALLLGLVASGIALYLTIVHYRHDLLVCATGGCETVQQSKYATIGPLPIAVLGLVAAVAMLGAAVLRIARRDLALPVTIAIFAMAAIGVGYEIYLTYVEIWVLEAICQWCVAFATVITLWMVLEAWRLWDEL